MNDEEIRTQIRNEILNDLKFETFKGAQIVTAVCVSVIVDRGAQGAQAVNRFFLPNGTFIGEVPAQNIVSAEKHEELKANFVR